MTPPDWLDRIGRSYFRRQSKALADRLDDTNIETFAVLCSIYSLMRQETDNKLKKNYIDAYIRLATQFGLTPRSNKLTPTKEDDTDELGTIFG